MLMILLKILSITGIVLLVILGIILALVLLVLFVPVCYRVEGAKSEESMFGDLLVTWLLGVVKVIFRYPEPGKVQIKIFGITLSEKKDDEAEETASKEPDDEQKKHPRKKTGRNDGGENMDNSHASISADEGQINSSQCSQVTAQADASADSNTSDNSNASVNSSQADDSTDAVKKPGYFANIRQKISDLKTRLNEAKETAKEALSNARFYKDLLTEPDSKELFGDGLKRLWKILKKLMPTRCKAHILFGAETPDVTGYVCAVYAVLQPHFNKKTDIDLAADFERKVLEGNIQAKGHLFLAYVVAKVVPVFLNRRLYAFMEKYRSHDKGKNH